MTPIYVLPAVSAVCFLTTVVLCCVYHHMKKNKKKMPLPAQAAGAAAFVLMLIFIPVSIRAGKSFTRVKVLTAKRIMADRVDLDGFYVTANGDRAKKALSLNEKEQYLAQAATEQNDAVIIQYKDSLYNRVKIPADRIAWVNADDEQSEDKVVITRYLAKETDGSFYRYGIRYAVTFGRE